MDTPIPHERLAIAVKNKAMVHCMQQEIPVMRDDGIRAVDADVQRSAQEYAERLPFNERQAIYCGAHEQFERGVAEIPFQSMLFSEVMALRERGERPRFIAASAIPVDYERRKLVLHRRSERVKTYPNAIHTVGGAYVPDADESLLSCAIREAHEEAGIQMSEAPPATLSKHDSVIIGEETSTGSFQVVLLHREFQLIVGAELRTRERIEGRPLILSFDELPSVIGDPAWVPSGRLHVFTWLAQIAAMEKSLPFDVHFAGKSAAQVLSEALNDPWHPPSNAIVL